MHYTSLHIKHIYHFEHSLCTLSAEACYVRNIATVGAPPASNPASPGYPLPPVSPSFALSQVAFGATSSSRSGSRSPAAAAAAAAQRPALAAKRALFSSRGALLAVALEDDTVLIARVEHFTSGARAGEELRVSV
jgi:plasmid stabilization system protein ParE